MKKLIVILLAGALVSSCGNSSSNENGAPTDSTLDVAGTDTSGGYNANNGQANTKGGNMMVDSSRSDSGQFSETDTSKPRNR